MNLTMRICLLLLALSTGCTSSQPADVANKDSSLTQEAVFQIHEHTLTPLLAMEPASRKRGLQHRTPPEDGLILCFPYSKRQSLWMPNCEHPLEAWVMSEHGEVLEILPLPAEPRQGPYETDWQYESRLPRHDSTYDTRFMWEFAAGEAQRRSIVPGDWIEGPWRELMDRIR